MIGFQDNGNLITTDPSSRAKIPGKTATIEVDNGTDEDSDELGSTAIEINLEESSEILVKSTEPVIISKILDDRPDEVILVSIKRK